MRKIISILLVIAIALIALHDYYVDQFDVHEIKQELHCNHLHHADFHLQALLPAVELFKEELDRIFEFTISVTSCEQIFSVIPPPPKTA